jgi:predicted nucleic acid-binding protein
MPSDSTVFVDTNVLLYSRDPRRADKQAQAAAWLRACWERQVGRISSQVMHEFYANLRRLAPSLTAEEQRSVVREYRAWTPWLVEDDTVDLAWALQDRYPLSYWDALMVAAAIEQGCRYLLTEDLQHAQHLDSVQVLNPFLVGPEVLDTPGTVA